MWYLPCSSSVLPGLIIPHYAPSHGFTEWGYLFSVVVLWIYRTCHFIREQVSSFGGDFGLLSSDETKAYEEFWVEMNIFCSMGWLGASKAWDGMSRFEAMHSSVMGHVGQPIFIFNLTGLEPPYRQHTSGYFGGCFQRQPHHPAKFLFMSIFPLKKTSN